MILLAAILAGLAAGLLRTKWVKSTWQPPELYHSWFALVAFLPQFFAFYLPVSRDHISVPLAAVCLISSQMGLLLFCLLNRHQTGIVILGAGLFLNLLVIVANGGFMPLSLEAAARLIPQHILQSMETGSRIGPASKDILLPFNQMVLPWLSDRFLPPAWFPYQFAFSIGDVLISLGAFLLLSIQQVFPEHLQKGSPNYVNQPSDQPATDGAGDALGLE